MSRSQFRRIWLILRLAWLNLQEESICYWQDQPVNYVPSDAAASSCVFWWVRFLRTDCSVDSPRLSAPAVRRFRLRSVCSSTICNPLMVHDQRTGGRPRVGSHMRHCGAGSSGREFHNSPKRGPALKLSTSTITRIRIQQLFLCRKRGFRLSLGITTTRCHNRDGVVRAQPEVLGQTFSNIVWLDRRARVWETYLSRALSASAFSCLYDFYFCCPIYIGQKLQVAFALARGSGVCLSLGCVLGGHPAAAGGPSTCLFNINSKQNISSEFSRFFVWLGFWSILPRVLWFQGRFTLVKKCLWAGTPGRVQLIKMHRCQHELSELSPCFVNFKIN